MGTKEVNLSPDLLDVGDFVRFFSYRYITDTSIYEGVIESVEKNHPTTEGKGFKGTTYSILPLDPDAFGSDELIFRYHPHYFSDAASRKLDRMVDSIIIERPKGKILAKSPEKENEDFSLTPPKRDLPGILDSPPPEDQG
jgi:hypothetical protein